ncbi:UxaA family hydrolase [bacterium]|nr:UxaA family hydrolase [bacterium]
MPLQAIIVNKNDNVATALRHLESGDTVRIDIGNTTLEIQLTQSIQFGHKFALDDIQAGNTVIKYGEKIGIASSNIIRGQHVHLHNVEGFRGRGDK